MTVQYLTYFRLMFPFPEYLKCFQGVWNGSTGKITSVYDYYIHPFLPNLPFFSTLKTPDDLCFLMFSEGFKMRLLRGNNSNESFTFA